MSVGYWQRGQTRLCHDGPAVPGGLAARPWQSLNDGDAVAHAVKHGLIGLHDLLHVLLELVLEKRPVFWAVPVVIQHALGIGQGAELLFALRAEIPEAGTDGLDRDLRHEGTSS
jgi:hypothetical protein